MKSQIAVKFSLLAGALPITFGLIMEKISATVVGQDFPPSTSFASKTGIVLGNARYLEKVHNNL